MDGIYIALSILLALACLAMIVAILMQKKRQAGFTGSISGGGMGDKTYWDKNKSKSFEGRLEKYTKILGAVFMILSLVISFIV
ncbi:MAG: preprotein translocase subunit SecG [Defluviitaleaceae bacterium]|nr:preprotein translocase subunit SecG [Defluviitaleaceae bacterium]